VISDLAAPAVNRPSGTGGRRVYAGIRILYAQLIKEKSDNIPNALQSRFERKLMIITWICESD